MLDVGRRLFGNLQIGVNPGEKRQASDEAGPSQQRARTDDSIEDQTNDLIRRARTLLKQARDSPPVSLAEVSALTVQIYEFIIQTAALSAEKKKQLQRYIQRLNKVVTQVDSQQTQPPSGLTPDDEDPGTESDLSP